jgi:SAM-dependent methyltransferase
LKYSKKLRELFPDISLHPEDLLLLETFQIIYLADRVSVNEFAILLRTYPVVQRFLLSKYPPIAAFLHRILEENIAVIDPQQTEEQCQDALWEIGDLIIYNKHPELFDAQAPIKWDMEEITAITTIEGKIVADVGAGSGRIAFLLAPFAQTVFAVEPITSFRQFMKKKAEEKNVKNLFVMDGTLDTIPLPNSSLDILITSNAIGWKLQKELKEIERVIKAKGHAIHLLQSNSEVENPFHDILVSSPWNYTCLQDSGKGKKKLIYYK